MPNQHADQIRLLYLVDVEIPKYKNPAGVEEALQSPASRLVSQCLVRVEPGDLRPERRRQISLLKVGHGSVPLRVGR